MRAVAGVDVALAGAHVLVTLTDEGGRKHTFELTRPLAEHLHWLLSVRMPLPDDHLLTPEEITAQSGRGREERASE